MRHKKKRLQLNRFTSWRKATLIGMAKSLILHQSIRTTHKKAKAAQPLAERLISLAKKNNLTGRRNAYKILGDHKLVSLLFNEIGARFKERLGGYTKIINLGTRRGDNAEMAILEFTEIKRKEIKKFKKEKDTKQEKITPAEATAGGIKNTDEPKIQPETQKNPPITKKPAKNFFKGLRQIFKKKGDSL